MAKKASKPNKATAQYHCRDCANSYDWHSMSIKGEPILCRCPHKQQGGKYCVFLNDPQCDKFKLRSK